MSIIIDIFLVLGLITLIFVSPVLMNIGLIRVSNNNYEISKTEFMYCCIPVFNHFYGWKRYSGKAISVSGISSILLYVVLILRAVAMFFFYENGSLQTYTVYAFLIAILLFWICNAANIYSILSDSGIYTFGSKVFNAFSVVIGQITVGYYMPRKMYYYLSKSKKGVLYGRS
jgi:hypothetical protein